MQQFQLKSEFIRPLILTYLKENGRSRKSDIQAHIFKLHPPTTPQDLQRFKAGDTRAENEVAWAFVYLKQAQLIANPDRAVYEITESGKQLEAEKHFEINRQFLMKYPGFVEFINRKRDKTPGAITKPDQSLLDDVTQEDDSSPESRIEAAILDHNEALKTDLMNQLSNISHRDFERLVLNVLGSLNYGVSDELTQYSRDGGIDGIIHQDHLELDSIYIQAKHYHVESSVGRPEVQKLAGAISGKAGVSKGILITLGKFTADAESCAKELRHQKIVLIDGRKFVDLMIKHEIGVSTISHYKLKQLDSDYFRF